MQISRPAMVSRRQSAPSQLMATNPTPTAIPAALPYNNNNNNNNAIPIHSNHNHNNNNNHSRPPPPMLVTQLPQHQQYPPLPPQGRIVSPVVSPIPPREPIIVGNHHAHGGSPNHPAHVVPNQQLGGGGGGNHTWQHHQLPQLNTTRSHDADENEKAETSSDVSSIHMGSIRPDPKYDPAKDPTSPENMDKPFVAPLEITIRVVKERRRKTLSSYHSSTSHTTHTTHSMSTTVTPTHAEDDKQGRPSEWGFQPHELPTTGSIPQLGLINSFGSDDASASNNSFSGSADQFQSAEERMYLEEDLLELQQQGMEGTNHQHTEEVKQRKGMVRREFNRRIMRFKKHKNKKKHTTNTTTTTNNNNTSNEFSGEDEDDNDSDASGNKIIIQLKIEDNEAKHAQAQVRANAQLHHAHAHSAVAPEQAPPKPPSKSNAFKLKSKNLHYPSPFGGRKHHQSNSMRMIVGQENGC